ANGRSMLMTETWVFPPIPATSRLKRIVSVEQTGVSSEGTEISSRALPAELARVTGVKSGATHWKSGALSPGLSAGPISVSGFPRIVTIPVHSCSAIVVLLSSAVADPSSGPLRGQGEVRMPRLRFPSANESDRENAKGRKGENANGAGNGKGFRQIRYSSSRRISRFRPKGSRLRDI